MTNREIQNSQGFEFELIRSARRKRSIALSLGDDGVLKISVPLRLRQRDIDEVIAERSAWISKRIRLVQEKRASREPVKFADGGEVPFMGFKCRLSVMEKIETGCNLKNKRFDIAVPSGLNDKERAEEIRLALRLFYKKRARERFRQRLDFWSKKLNLAYKGFAIAEPQHQWGSCNSENFIRLNWTLLMAPLPLIDYVVAHELCHVRHKNHSQRFWNLLASVMPDCVERRRQLRQAQHRLKNGL
jgi:predicted metal-dependent hydrolase